MELMIIHSIKITDIIKDDNITKYYIDGYVNSEFDKPSQNVDDFINIEYTITDSIFRQECIKRENFMETRYNDLELLRLPFNKGAIWTWEVHDSILDKIVQIECTISSITKEDDVVVYEVTYKDTASGYNEVRKIKEGIGIIYYQKYDPDTKSISGYKIQ